MSFIIQSKFTETLKAHSSLVFHKKNQTREKNRQLHIFQPHITLTWYAVRLIQITSILLSCSLKFVSFSTMRKYKSYVSNQVLTSFYNFILQNSKPASQHQQQSNSLRTVVPCLNYFITIIQTKPRRRDVRVTLWFFCLQRTSR